MKKIAVSFIGLLICTNLLAQNVGIGNNAPTQKLDVTGNIRVSGAIMPGGTAGTAGQVLTSNGAGNAPTWQDLTSTGGGKFWILPANNTRATSSFTGRGGWNLSAAAGETSQDDSLDFGASNVSGSDFTISNPGLTNNFITVNRTGLYHFEGSLRFFVTCDLTVTMLPRITLDFLVNQPSSSDLSLVLMEDRMDKTGGTETGSGANNHNFTAKFQFNIHLQAGSTCTFRTGFNLLRFPGGENIIAMGVSQGGYISGHFIAE